MNPTLVVMLGGLWKSMTKLTQEALWIKAEEDVCING
jgi:hypothetical protein